MDPATIAKTLKHSPSLHQQQPLFSRVMDQTHPLHYIKSFSSSHKKTSTLEVQDSSYLKPQDNEIRIFDAHKYFGQNDNARSSPRPHQNNDSRLSSASSADGKNFRTRSFHATPTASSDASWNSQTGLLVNPLGSVKAPLDKVTSKKSTSSGKSSSSNTNKKSIFGRNKCCCTGKKSVRVKEATTSASVHHLGPTSPPPTPTSDYNNNSNKIKKKIPKGEKVAISKSTVMSQRSSTPTLPPKPLVLSPRQKPDTPRQQRISASGRSFVGGATSGFSFPILKNPAQAAVGPPGGFKGMITKAIVSPLDEDPPRDSLEVYQPMGNITPPARHHHFHPSSPIARMETTDDDLGSDASSDLFELDSFSTQTSLYPMYRRRDSLDEAPTFNARKFNNNNNNNNSQYDRQSLDETPKPSVTATECYAPSEASIDWSVTTAEGYDRASVSNFSVSASETGGTAFLRQRLKEDSGGEGGKRKGNGGGLMNCRHGKAVSVGPQPVKCSPAEGSGKAHVYGMHVGGRPPRASKTTPKLGNDRSARLSPAFAA